jgi:para-nitrobenzyl esterase
MMKFRCTALFLALASFVSAQTSNPLRIATDKGTVEGSFTADQKVRAFKGIPFAAPPTGALRWKPPQAAAAWKGIRSAKEFGSHCIQSASYSDMVFHDPGPSEDCLTLNVWAPANAKPGSLPVMVWIFGGGFVAGGTSESRQDGQFLAHKDVVVVSMNYRLGIFGFFTHPQLAAESVHQAAGNYGLLDQAAAIQWVQRNIAAFGGNPSNITIFGESAGSFSVSAQMASPLTKGLLSKAIGESGGAFFSSGLPFEPLTICEMRDAQFAESVLHAHTLAQLRAISAEDLRKAATAKTTPPPPRFGPDIDGYFLPDSIPSIYAAGKQAHIPVIAGWNADEMRGAAVSAKTKPTPQSFSADAQKQFGENAPEFLKVYPAKNDAEALQSAGDYAGDHFIAYSTWRWLEAQVKTGHASVYRYFFTLGSPGDKYHPAAAGAFHSDDIEYVFGALDSRSGANWRPEDRRLSEQMQTYWTNFARTGSPNGIDLPKWPAYDAPQWQVMYLDAHPAAKPDPYRERYLFLDKTWGKD